METFKLGTVIKITTTISSEGADPDSVKITIEDEAGTKKVDDKAMTKTDSTHYYYIYQSSASDTEGRHYVTTSVKKGDYTGLSKTTFALRD